MEWTTRKCSPNDLATNIYIGRRSDGSVSNRGNMILGILIL